ncbi:T9SS type A sorting domain-containing protein [Ohtaekwangia kribbensis]|uniref:T9SS type A sorting domain-containing protein n=1 Tax=Ohtaekwangia kribbensis TaxID=688913 RepID=A0ABW3K3M0_9BACT
MKKGMFEGPKKVISVNGFVALRKVCLLLLFASIGYTTFGQRYWVATTASNWNNAANWSTTSGGTGGASVPGAGVAAIFNGSGTGNCTLDMAPTIGSISISGYTGTINLNGNSLTISGSTALTFSSGTISNSGATASVVLSTTSSATFNGTTISPNITGTAGSITFSGGSTFGGTVTLSAANILLNGTTSSVNTFNGITTLTKTGTGNDLGTGGNRFNGTTSLINTATSGTFETANNYYDIFNGNLTLTCSNSGAGIPIADGSAGNQFNGNIVVNSSGADISFCNGSTSATATLAEGKTITAGTFTAGGLYLRRFTQGTTAAGTAQTITLTGTGNLVIGPTSTFNGSVTFKAPQMYLNGCTYNSTAYLEKSGGSHNLGDGGNTFNGVTTIVNSGSGVLTSANNNPDTFNGILTLTNSGTSGLYVADKAAGNVFNNNIIINSTAGSGIVFCNNSPATASLASGKTITVGTSFTTGTLGLFRFTQLGSTAQILTLTGTANLAIGPSSTFNGSVTFKSPQVYLQGCTYNGTTYIEKTGATANLGNGGNTFNGTTTLVNSGSAYFATAYVSPDIFNADVTATNTGSSWVALSDDATGTQFNGNIIVNSTNSTNSAGVTFGNGPHSWVTCTLASGKTISVGSIGFTAGRLRLRGFIQNGTTPQTLTLTGTAQLLVGNLSTFNGDVTFKSPQLYLDGCTYNGTAYLEKTGATDNLATLGGNTFNSTAAIINSGSGFLRTNGGNTFNGTTTITNTGSSNILLEYTTASTYNGDVTFTSSGSSSSRIWTAYNGANAFNGNIIVNSTAGVGITFCGGTGTATLANTKTITVGSSGFTTGTLTLQRFTQTGSTAQAMTFTGTGTLTIGPTSTFNAAVTFKAPQLYINGCSYNGITYLEKTGATDNLSTGSNTFATTASIVNSGSGYVWTSGNNTFNGTTAITNSGSSSIALEFTNGGTYNGDVTYSNIGTSSSIIYAAHNSSSAFNGNIVVNSTGGAGITFCGNTTASATLASGKTITTGATGFTTGTLTLQRFTQTGSTAQTITFTGNAALTVGPSTTFNGNATFTSPQVYLNGATYNAEAHIEKDGATANLCTGGNVFNGTTVLTNSSAAQWALANSAADTFNGAVTFTQTSTGALQPSYAGTNSMYGDIIINSTTPITFGTGTGIVQLSGSNNQTITSASSIPVIQRLVVNKTSNTNSVTLNTPVTIGNSATFTTGIVNTTSTNYLNFASGSSVSGASSSSFVDGPVRKTGSTAFIFPTGDNAIYRPIAITAPTTATDAFTAQFFKVPQSYGNSATFSSPLYTVSGCEFWILDRTTGTSAVSVTLGWNSSDCPIDAYVTDPATLVVARWDGSAWVSHGNGGTTGNAAAGTVTSSAAVTSFSPFALGSTTSNNPLPVELTSFSCNKVSNGTVQLSWITASESNSDYFSIEKSNDGISFESIGKKEAAGNSTTAVKYTFVDTDPSAGKAYYRLKQIDLDGKSEYSDLCFVNNELEEYKLKIYPNPAGNTVYINLGTEESPSVSVLNNWGDEVPVRIYDGDNGKVLDTTGLPDGLYIVEVTINRKVFKEKVIVQR